MAGRLNTAAREAIPQKVSEKWSISSNPFPTLDPVYLALSRLRRRRFDDCLSVSTEILTNNALDQQVWWIKCRALTNKNWFDDTEIEEEGVAELLLDDNATSTIPRPGTSLARPNTQSSGPSQAVRPTSNGGRPLSGFSRPGTGSRPATGSVSVEQAMTAGRLATAASRPVTTSGRFVRLGTASLASEPGGPFVNLDRVNFGKYAQHPPMAKALCDYILYVEHKPKKAVELCAAATAQSGFGDWWWKARLGKCYYQLGLLRDAERQFLSSIKDQSMPVTHLELGKIYLRLDQPNKAVEVYDKAAQQFPTEVSLMLASGRVKDMMRDSEAAADLYKQVLVTDGTNVEALASLAALQFYSDQPEIALRYYRRLLQMGVQGAELWNNLGLCCFYSGQYDMCLTCFERALQTAGDESLADIWYNVSHLAIGIGDVGLAYQALKVAVAADGNHAEAVNNLAVLELKKGNVESGRSGLNQAMSLSTHSFEPRYNAALLCFKLGEAQDAFELAQRSLALFPDHTESQDLLQQLRSKFC